MTQHRAHPSEPVVKRALASGEVGKDWLEGLSELVDRLAEDWSLGISRPLRGGTEAYVVEAMTLAGEGAVLKIYAPGVDPTRAEMRALRTAAGRGYARWIRYDEATGAMLLERLGVQLSEQKLPIERQHRILCQTLREAWIIPNEGEQFMTGAEKAESLAAFISEQQTALGSPAPQAAVDQALAYAESRRAAFDPAKAVLGHGDAHAYNCLYAPAVGPDRYKFVDPDGLFIEPAYDLGIVMREDSEELLAADALKLGRKRAERLSQLTGVDRQAIWEWGVIERVSTGLHCVQLGYDEWSAPILQVAEAWAA
jgi:streptomycin 6-kinase